MGNQIEQRTARPPAADEVRAWQAAYRETAAAAIADILRAVETSTASGSTRRPGERAA